jgi:hypothetical protein
MLMHAILSSHTYHRQVDGMDGIEQMKKGVLTESLVRTKLSTSMESVAPPC